MEVYVKESLFVLDYDDNIVDTIFASDDHRTAGYAYNVTITEANTGYSDLKFDMPNVIITDDAEKIKNPKLALLTPLVKLRYRREVYYTGDKSITVREPQGYGDTTNYVDKTYSNKYPNNLIEDYVMDYIVQPVDKKRDVLKLYTSFTAIDYPRFNLGKKKVGLAVADGTITKREWSLFENKPLDIAGTIKYQPWTKAMSDNFQVGDDIIPTEWNPLTATEYPLTKDNIIKMMGNVAIWPYGLLATAFYWPIVETGRFDGVLYEKGGFLILRLYDFYNLSTEGIDPDLYVDRYSWEWSQIYEVQPLLAPNNALNYLRYTLDGTNWSIALKEDGTPDVALLQTEVPNPSGEGGEMAELRCGISLNNSNCYNMITTICKAFQLYPVFDCINRTVALREFAGKNYGLTFSLGHNLQNNNTKLDGEKVITKLYVSGGKDYNGSTNINIGTATRSYLQNFGGFYNSTDIDSEANWVVVDTSLPNSAFQYQKYNKDLTTTTITVHDNRVKDYWISGPDRAVYVKDNTTGAWTEGTKLPSGNYSITLNGIEYIIDPETGREAPWSPNDDAYITSRSPYGTNYILNLKWAYDNKWITKEQVLELYQLENQINEVNIAFVDGYIQDRLATQQAYQDAKNDYDLAQDGFESTLHAMENKYYNVAGDVSKGTTYCFHKSPKGTYSKFNSALGKNTYWIKIAHCYACNHTDAITANGSEPAGWTTCPKCNSTDIANNEIYIPTYGDYEFVYKPSDYPYGTDVTRTYEGYNYNPHLKGYFLRLVMSLDRANASWTIGDYENRVYLTKTIPFEGDTITGSDGYNYKIDSVYVRSTSGQIEIWNESIVNYIENYGKMLDYLRKLNAALDRIALLDELYDKYEETIDGYHALIQEKFGDYLIEGNYTNDEQPYIPLLFKEGLEASDKFSTPEITYNLNVVDATGLIEYREPQITKYECADCGYISYHNMVECVKCGSKNILTINDIYNDLVHMLHSIGQIVPKAGDYVAVYDEPMGMFGVPALITEISRTLDNPFANSIKLDTGYTDDEELVGNIITATNTVLNNTDIYARTSILNRDGTIESTAVKTSLDNSKADINIVGTNGNVLLNGSGLRCTDPTDPARAMKYAGNGIFFTTNLSSESGEATIWEKMMSPSGINATYLRAGTIDTNKITVMSGLSGKVILDQYGLSVRQNAGKTSHITPFDSSAAKSDASYAKKWGSDNNIASFVGVDSGNNPLIYTKGFLYAEEGSNIANWISSNDGFYHLSGTKKDLWLSPNGITGVVNNSGNQKFAIYAGGNFGVTTGGKLYAKDADIQGAITSNNVNITGGALSIGNNFKVDNNGNLTAKNANVTGTITTDNLTATNGSISNITGTNMTIQNGTITSATLSDCSISAAQINSGVLSSARIPNLSAGKITSGTMSADRISGGTLKIKDASGGEFSIGTDTTHASTTGLNVGSAGILFGSQAASTQITGDSSEMTVQGATKLNLGINGTVMMVMSPNGVTSKGKLYLNNGINSGSHDGQSVSAFKCEDPLGTPRLWFENGLLVAYDTGDGTVHWA